MNTNRSNNRRRGRGSNRGPGGGNQANRIDNRARGNAPQMLDKYKKLAHDASLNDDRVQTEYYLQFADHYFRVIADNRAQKDDQRGRRDGDRDDSADDQEEESERDSRGGDDRARAQVRRPRDSRASDDDPRVPSEGSRGFEGDEVDSDQGANPFTREARPAKPRGRTRRKAGDEDSAGDAALEADRLPPSIARKDEDGGKHAEGGEGTGKSRVRTAGAKTPRGSKRRSSPAEDGDAEELKAAS